MTLDNALFCEKELYWNYEYGVTHVQLGISYLFKGGMGLELSNWLVWIENAL